MSEKMAEAGMSEWVRIQENKKMTKLKMSEWVSEWEKMETLEWVSEEMRLHEMSEYEKR